MSLLNSHPDVVCDSEILAQPRAFPTQYIAARAALAGRQAPKAYGFKLISTQFRHARNIGNQEKYLRHLHERGYEIVFLDRRDLLQHAVSMIRSYRGVPYHQRRGEQAAFDQRELDPLEVIDSMYRTEEEAIFLELALADVPHLRLVYEDDLLDASRHQATADRIFSQLGLPSAPVDSDLVKITPRRSRDLIANFDEVAGLLRATRYASYVSEA